MLSVYLTTILYKHHQLFFDMERENIDPLLCLFIRDTCYDWSVLIALDCKFNIFICYHYSEDLKYEHLKSGLFEGRISNGLAFAMAIVPTIWKTGLFKNRTFLTGFQMVFDRMAAICLDFKYLNVQQSDSPGLREVPS